jgi:uncharacterized protein
MKNMMKKLFCLTVALLLVLALPLSVHAMDAMPKSCEDYGRVLTTTEEDALNESLKEISRRLGINVAIRTDMSLDGHAIEDVVQGYANINYAQLDNPSGIVLLYIAIEERAWYIYSEDDAYEYLTSPAMNDINDAIIPLLSMGNYYDAFVAYAQLCDKYLTMGKEGNPYHGPFPWLQNIIIALGVGLLVGIIATNSMRSQLKSVRPRHEAHEYTRPGSMNVTLSRDLFLYRTVHRRPRPKDTSSSSRSGSSRSGGRGGHF